MRFKKMESAREKLEDSRVSEDYSGEYKWPLHNIKRKMEFKISAESTLCIFMNSWEYYIMQNAVLLPSQDIQVCVKNNVEKKRFVFVKLHIRADQ